jgi:hypothetical protein
MYNVVMSTVITHIMQVTCLCVPLAGRRSVRRLHGTDRTYLLHRAQGQDDHLTPPVVGLPLLLPHPWNRQCLLCIKIQLSCFLLRTSYRMPEAIMRFTPYCCWWGHACHQAFTSMEGAVRKCSHKHSSQLHISLGHKPVKASPITGLGGL